MANELLIQNFSRQDYSRRIDQVTARLQLDTGLVELTTTGRHGGRTHLLIDPKKAEAIGGADNTTSTDTTIAPAGRTNRAVKNEIAYGLNTSVFNGILAAANRLQAGYDSSGNVHPSPLSIPVPDSQNKDKVLAHFHADTGLVALKVMPRGGGDIELLVDPSVAKVIHGSDTVGSTWVDLSLDGRSGGMQANRLVVNGLSKSAFENILTVAKDLQTAHPGPAKPTGAGIGVVQRTVAAPA